MRNKVISPDVTPSDHGLAHMMCGVTEVITKDATILKPDNLLLENQPLIALFGLIEQHKLYINILEENEMCNTEEKRNIVQEFIMIFSIIKVMSGSR